MAETSSLLNCRTGNRTTSSNLVLSALRNQQTSVARKCGAFVVERPQAKARFRRRPLIDKERAAKPPESLLIACGVTRRAPEPPGVGANLVRDGNLLMPLSALRASNHLPLRRGLSLKMGPFSSCLFFLHQAYGAAVNGDRIFHVRSGAWGCP